MAKPDLDAIRARCEAATLGEWVSKKFGGYHHIYKGPIKVKGISMSHDGEICEMEYAGISDKTKKEINANSLFIAYSRTDIPELLDYIAKLEAVVNEAQKVMQMGILSEETPCEICEDSHLCENTHCPLVLLENALKALDGSNAKTD